MEKDICEQLKNELSEKYECYVLITCGKPALDGEMEVSFSFGGDPDLASYLITGAQAHLDEEVEYSPAHCN